jgi:hypothetical protein
MLAAEERTVIASESADGDENQPEIEAFVERRLADDCPYAVCFKNVTFDCRSGVLTLRGRLPTFYLKQVLQTLVKDIDGVARLDNQVSVTGSRIYNVGQ